MVKITKTIDLLTFGSVASVFNSLSKNGYMIGKSIKSLSSGQSFLLGAGIYIISNIFQGFLFNQRSYEPRSPITPRLQDILFTILTGAVSNLLFINLSVSSALTGGAIAIVAIVAAIIFKIIIEFIFKML